MNNENLLGVHADIEEVSEVAFHFIEEEERGRREMEHRDAEDRTLKTVRAIHEEGREDQRYWLEFSRWMMHDSENIPQEIKWGMKLHEWSTKAPREKHQYWGEFANWFPEEEIPREIRWGIAWTRWRTDLVNDLKKLRARLRREVNDAKTV